MKNTLKVFLRALSVCVLCVAIMLANCITPLAISLDGDIDGDSALTASDLTLIRKALLNNDTDSKYDINGDGSVNLKDLVNLKKKVAYYYDGEKFLSKGLTQAGNVTDVTLGSVFESKDGIDIDSSLVKIEVEALSGDVTYIYTPDTENWENSVIDFDGTGEVTVTIYEYCKPTAAVFTVAYEGEKFNVKFPNTDSYLYRVGNANEVALGSLFGAVDGVAVNSADVSLEVSATNGNVSATVTENANDWTESEIQFSGTGIAEIKIKENCNETVLTVEVVDATNVTAYSELGNKNCVLLNDITMSSGSSYYLSNATLYGNGFTFDVTNGAYDSSGYLSSNYVVSLVSAGLDNVKLTGAVYTSYGATIKDNYNRSLVLSSGNSTINNCYISNCAAPVRVNGGTIEIANSTLKGGNFANLDIRNGNVVLDNVTTVNQVNSNDTAADGTVVVGLGVVVYYENVLDTTTVEIKNGITQYNHLSESQAEEYITDTTASQLTSKMFESDYSSVQYSDGTETWVNTGILSMTSNVGDSNISDVDGYTEVNPTMTGTTGYLHTKKPDATAIEAIAPEYITDGQGAISPSYSFDYTTKNYVAKTDGSNDYCYEENGVVYISMDEGDTFDWDTSILTAAKNGTALEYTVNMGGTDYTGKTIPFNTAGNYQVNYTYTDKNNYGVDENGNITTYEKSYTKAVYISVSVIKPTTKHAEFTFGSSGQASEKITVGNNTYISATGVSHDNSTWSYITVSGQKIYYPIVEATIVDKKIAYFNVFKNVVSITDYADGGTGAEVVYNSSTTTMPSGLTVVKGVYKPFADISSNWSTLNDTTLTLSGASNVFKYAASASASATPTTYNGALVFASPEVTNARNEYITIVQYSYTDNANTTYYYYVGYHMAEKGKASTCVTSDTLVTLADGSQKEIQDVTYADKLLVWDFYKGEYTAMPSSIIMNHGYDKYEVVTLNFDDGTTVNTINGHGFFNVASNKFVIIGSDNAEDYIGQHFVKDAETGTTAKLISYSVKYEYTESWSILTSEYYNCILEGMLTLTPAEVDGSPEYLMPFEIGEDMKYVEEAMKADIAKYGLYTYDEFAEYVTEEQFNAFGFANFKVSVGKGYITWEEIMDLISIHIG